MADDHFERVEITSLQELRSWLRTNHTQSESIWLVTYKKRAGEKYVPRDDVIDEALCFGWIDSLPRKLDEDRTMLRLSPRKASSAWSKVNKDKVARLIATGRMQPAGQKMIEIAKKNGMWDFLNDVDNLVQPADLIDAFSAHPGSKAAFDGFPKSSQRGILEWIKQAKTGPTRAKRIKETARLAAKGLRANFPESRGK